MNDCIKASVNTTPLDPKKRLNYEFGMVLGVNDFRQEQEHQEWKHRLGNRLLHGYGTVCGLQVSTGKVAETNDVEIRISPGYALTPKGNWVYVEKDQCGLLNEWLQRHDNDLSPPTGAGPQRVFVTLCYDECYTELVPIAGQACASDADSAKPSRILESFRIEFSWRAPEQAFEDAARAFGELMRRVEFIPSPASLPDVDDGELLVERVRSLGLVASPPPASPPDEHRLLLFDNTACATLRRALNVWATEVCPRLASTEDCLLLAAVDFSIDASGNLAPDTVTTDESERPVLIADRLKQELFCLFGGTMPM